MIRYEILVVLFLVAGDILMTYYLLYRSKTAGAKGWIEFERNPIIRRFIEKHGLHKGIRIGFIYSMALMTGAFIYFNWRSDWIGFTRIIFFAMGFYVMLNIMHILSIQLLHREIEQLGLEKGGKAKKRKKKK